MSMDVVMDELHMCHVLDFRNRLERLPSTLDVADLLLSKLQVVELNEKERPAPPVLPPYIRLPAGR